MMSNVNRVRFSLRAYKTKGDVAYPTNILGISPIRVSTYGNPKLTGWIWETSTLRDADMACKRFLQTFSGKARKLGALRRAGWKLDAVLFCEVKGEASGGGPLFSPESLIGIGRMGISFWIDLYTLVSKR